MKTPQELIDHASIIEKKLGYTFTNKSLLAIAFTHCSFTNEVRGPPCENNERLEFLGDSVLNLILTDELYQRLPNVQEGELSHRRSRLVDAAACLGYLQQLDVAEYLLLGRGEQRNDGRGRDSILSNLFEAIIGAIYLDGGLEAARSYFVMRFGAQVTAAHLPHLNAKAELQTYTQTHTQQQPKYQVVSESGPDHHKQFVVAVLIAGEEAGRGTGPSKKEAQQAAAADALTRLHPS